MLAHGVCDKEKNTKIRPSAFTSCHEELHKAWEVPGSLGHCLPCQHLEGWAISGALGKGRLS